MGGATDRWQSGTDRTAVVQTTGGSEGWMVATGERVHDGGHLSRGNLARRWENMFECSTVRHAGRPGT
jgi:hypothetical protein